MRIIQEITNQIKSYITKNIVFKSRNDNQIMLSNKKHNWNMRKNWKRVSSLTWTGIDHWMDWSFLISFLFLPQITTSCPISFFLISYHIMTLQEPVQWIQLDPSLLPLPLEEQQEVHHPFPALCREFSVYKTICTQMNMKSNLHHSIYGEHEPKFKPICQLLCNSSLLFFWKIRNKML